VPFTLPIRAIVCENDLREAVEKLGAVIAVAGS